MKNVRIVATVNRTVVVKADTERFGKDAIMYEGHTFMQCCDYIRRACRTNHFKLTAYSCEKMFTDSDGCTMPWLMSVAF